MPIKGLTTDIEAPGRGLPRIATLYKGDRKPEDGRRPGKDLKHFRVEFEPQFEDLRAVWDELYEREPKEFTPVFLAAPKASEAFSTWMEEWTATTMLHRCDGDDQVAWYNPRTGMYMQARKACEASEQGGCKCSRIGRLNLILPELVDASGVLGYVTIATHSVHDIITIYRYLTDIERMYGQLTGVPFVFGRAVRQVSAPKPGKPGERIRTTKSLLYIHVDPEFTKTALLPMLAGRAQPALPEGPAASAATGRRLLGNGGSRRLVGGETVAAFPEALDVSNGYFDDGDEADYAAEAEANELVGPPWSQAEAKAFAARCRSNALNDREILAALGVSRLGEWPGNVAEATAAVNAWIEAQHQESA